MAEDEEGIPSEAEHEADAALMRQLEVFARKFDKADAKKDFASKVELARRVVQILDFAKGPECCSPAPADERHPQ